VELSAIKGETPVRSELSSYGHQWIDEEDIASVVESLRSEWITQGPNIDEFEKKVSDYCDAKHAIAFSSGTTALHAACAVAGVSRDDEVITTPITFVATANAIIYCGGKPVLADIREDTLNIDPVEIRARISPRTKAILPVDFTGHPTDLDEIMQIARKNNLVVIEDACHALGAKYKGSKIGSLVDMTVFSFHPVKHITTGEGGMVLTNHDEYVEKLRTFRHHGIIKRNSGHGSWHYEIEDLGYNFRITDFQSALGISQLKKLDSFVMRRREIAARYNHAFSTMDEVITPIEVDEVKSAYHLYVIQLQIELLEVGRKEIFESLRAENIGVNVHYIPVHFHPYYQREFGYKNGDYPKAEKYYERAITLPLYPKMSNEDVESVIKAVRKVIEHYRKN